MVVNLEHSGISMEIWYSEDGVFDHVKNIGNGNFMMIETKQEGMGYTIKRDNYIMPMDICDARYVRIMELDIFIPRLIFITNKHEE